MTKFLNTILILIILVAGAKLVMQGREYRTLAQERKQLVEKLDGFYVRDSSKYLVQAVDTGDPMLFMWRVHKPGGFRTEHLAGFVDGEYAVFGAGGSWESKLERVSARFEFIGDELYVDMQTARGGHRSRIGDAELVPICRQHWNDFEFEVLGQGDAIEIDVSQEVGLLRITVPDEWLANVEVKFGKDLARRFSKKLFCQLSLGERGVIARLQEQSQRGSR